MARCSKGWGNPPGGIKGAASKGTMGGQSVQWEGLFLLDVGEEREAN